MLKTKIIHPDILAALARAGHGSRVLIADGNYPFSTTLKSGPYAMKEEPPIWKKFRAILQKVGFENELEKIERFEFYETVKKDNVALTIATGEKRIYANLLLTIGVVKD